MSIAFTVVFRREVSALHVMTTPARLGMANFGTALLNRMASPTCVLGESERPRDQVGGAVGLFEITIGADAPAGNVSNGLVARYMQK